VALVVLFVPFDEFVSFWFAKVYMSEWFLEAVEFDKLDVFLGFFSKAPNVIISNRSHITLPKNF